MPIEYSLAERGNPGKPSAPKKFYAVARSQGEVSVRDIAGRINQMSTVSTIDVMAVLEAFFQTVPQELADGRIVRFGDFGSFSVSLQGEGADTEKEFNAALINNVKVVFRPGKLFAQAMQGAELRKVSTPLPATQRQAASRKKAG
ncbi:HU family DNA-binding protein [Hymenobacter psychrotolerans]|uniref:DNA-binding protein, histone-like, putative n=1 Tax=Hymenobacter psychrotolerans DSM 18569 TaxID=1121959 RepID=A0A1M6VKP3_9BACT|nr:HU family DNA-binding protein [Hymenobacter psychrotolerans]SHK81806.1 DNA-binding protein, histone-like, putative [Hymenobacter psychrotolerans DSM 18569]